ncbi:unnamed protein product [Prorocentrum cordatum]|uniref:Phospholipase B-like n=2 Tax=Prorocentrum cordatum TaxID=2364126 RepID=A0ABN9R5V5_9DINO|nr:unnamed protein product [Polarella glacialis]
MGLLSMLAELTAALVAVACARGDGFDSSLMQIAAVEKTQEQTNEQWTRIAYSDPSISQTLIALLRSLRQPIWHRRGCVAVWDLAGTIPGFCQDCSGTSPGCSPPQDPQARLGARELEQCSVLNCYRRSEHACGPLGWRILDMALQDIQALAAGATRVRINSVGDPNDGVVSTANTWPIEDVRLGRSIGAARTISSTQVSAIWSGTQVNRMWKTCSGNYVALDVMIYQACGNNNGLHWASSTSKWSLLGSTVGLELYIDAAASPSPTLSPTASPTPSPTASPSASPTSSPSPSPTPSPTPSPAPSPTASPTASPSASPTASPSVSPTPSPTPNPTASPSASPTASPTVMSMPLTVAGKGDPHLVNVHGQKFDLYQPGVHPLIRIPKATRKTTALLVLARATQIGDGCNDMARWRILRRSTSRACGRATERRASLGPWTPSGQAAPSGAPFTAYT